MWTTHEIFLAILFPYLAYLLHLNLLHGDKFLSYRKVCEWSESMDTLVYKFYDENMIPLGSEWDVGRTWTMERHLNQNRCPVDPNYYEVLGLGPKATTEEITTAYHQLSDDTSLGETDTASESPQTQQDLLKRALEVLETPYFRCLYDHYCDIRDGKWQALQKLVSLELCPRNLEPLKFFPSHMSLLVISPVWVQNMLTQDVTVLSS